MNFSELKDNALATLQGWWGQAVVITLIYAIIAGGAASLVLILCLLVTLPLEYSFSVIFLEKVRGKEVQIGNLFDGFNDFGRIFLTLLLRNVYIFLWSLLLIIPGIIKSISYSQTTFILKDHPELSYNGAIDRSMEMMVGHKMDYFLLCLSFIGWILLAILTMGIGNLWLLPYIRTTLANFYEELKGSESAMV